MSWLDNLAARFGYTKAPLEAPPTWLAASARAERYNLPDLATVEQQSKLFQKLTWVQIAITTVAQTAAGSAFNVKERTGEDTRDIPNHEFEQLLARPNPLMSRFELLEATFAYRNLTGNAYWYLNKAGEDAPPDEIWVIPPHQIMPVPDGRSFLKGYLFDPGEGEKIPLEPWEVCHFKRFHPLNKYVGLSPIEALNIVAIGDIKMQEWNTNVFAKNNAKIPGALAFAEMIGDEKWNIMKTEIAAQHGGTNRMLMLLRGVGKGGVEWVPMAMSQKDMEFINARTFTKEEIFAIYAPGLASVLAVNATEANSSAGKQTFLEFSVWPNQVAVAEKISNDVLPAYGDDLIGEFEDPRLTDRALDLQEQLAYERVHTVDEVREKFYSAQPLGDERGRLLTAEIGKGLTDARAPEDKPPPPPQLIAPKPPPQLTGPTVEEGDAEIEDTAASDLAKWERKALKRLWAGEQAACDFVSGAISDAQHRAVSAALRGATTAEEVRAAFLAATFQGKW